MINTPTHLILHHTTVSTKKRSKQLWAVNSYHQWVKGFSRSELGFYVGYHYFLEADGKLIKTRNDNEEGMHTLNGWNRKSIGVCLAGDFYEEAPTRAQLVAIRGLIKKYNLPYMFHKEADPRRTCAGAYITRDLIDTEIPPMDEIDKEKAIELSKIYPGFSYGRLIKIIRSLKQ